MAQGIQQPAFVLRKRSYQESSELVDFFSPEKGRISCVVKGAKRKRIGGTLAQRLQLFRPLLVRYHGRGSLKLLSDVEDLQVPHALSNEAYYAAHYINELLLRILQEEESYPELFAQYAKLLAALSAGSSPRVTIRRFEWRVLQALGADPDLRSDAQGKAIDRNKCYHFVADEGWYEAPQPGGSGVVQGVWLEAFAGHDPEAWASRTARELLEHLLRPYVGKAPFKSRLLWQQQVQQQQ